MKGHATNALCCTEHICPIPFNEHAPVAHTGFEAVPVAHIPKPIVD